MDSLSLQIPTPSATTSQGEIAANEIDRQNFLEQRYFFPCSSQSTQTSLVRRKSSRKCCELETRARSEILTVVENEI